MSSQEEGAAACEAQDANFCTKGLDVERAELGRPDVRARDAANVAHGVDEGDGGGLLCSRTWDCIGDPRKHDEARREPSYPQKSAIKIQHHIMWDTHLSLET